MNFKNMSDRDLLLNTKQLVATERDYVSQVLHHLREVERRKLYSDLRYASLFEYAVKELKYSEGQAGRRIQAMRLLQELPELEHKLQSGELNLTHMSMAQSYFKTSQKKKIRKIPVSEKLELLNRFSNTTSREAEKVLIALDPAMSLPKESIRYVNDEVSEVRFLMNRELSEQIEQLKSIMGIRALSMNFADLVKHMTEISLRQERINRFGKKITDSNYYVTEKRGVPMSHKSRETQDFCHDMQTFKQVVPKVSVSETHQGTLF